MKLKNALSFDIGGFLGVVAIAALAVVAAVPKLSAQAPQGPPAGKGAPPVQAGALSKENLAKPRPKPPFDLTGNWMFSPQQNRDNGVFGYTPLPKLKAGAQALYNASIEAAKQGKAFHNDEGACYPAGMPEMMTRVWPNQTIQLPTMILMIQMLKHELRWIYLDGRQHADPEIKAPSYSGDSIGHWDGDTLVVETTNFEPNHHWVQTGIPISDQFKIVERIKLKDDGKTMEDTFVMTDPVNWEGEWVNTKRWYRYDNSDIEEAFCLPDLNSRLPATDSASNIR